MVVKREYTCIVCPVSCRIAVEEKDGQLEIKGNTCKRGYEFARNEHTLPKRMLTSTVAVSGGSLSRLPVVSSEEIPKKDISKCLEIVYKTEVNAPVCMGDVIIENILGIGVDIVASRSLK